MAKSKSLYGYQIGATIETQERGADVNIVPDNKTLIALPLNDEPDIEADPTRLKNMKEVFEKYEPKVEVDLKNLEGEAQYCKNCNNKKKHTPGISTLLIIMKNYVAY